MSKQKTICVHQHVLSLQFTCIELVIQWTICRLIVDAKIRASDKDLPVHNEFFAVRPLGHTS